MGNVFYREPGTDYPLLARGEGVYLYDSQGRRYLDGSGGAAVSAVGHGHAHVIAAIRRQIESCAFAHTMFFTNEPQEQLAEMLATRFGQPDARVYFVSGGSEANETAIKLARQYWLARGRPDKSVFISREQSYHGNTLGALALSGNPGRRALFGPMLNDWPKIEPCYAYRRQRETESDEAYAERAASALQVAIDKAGADNVAAFFAETVVGATLGVVPPVPGYLERIREICDRNDVLLILDEVMAGCGRCGTYFAYEQDGISPDIVTVAKGLAGGYQPLGAAIARGHIHDAVVAEFGNFAHGHTYVGHATACAAGVAVAEVVENEQLLANARERGDALRAGLHEALHDHPHVGDIRGRGQFTGIELVVDRAARTPPPRDLGLAVSLRRKALAKGLICYPGSGSANGADGAHIMLAPPLIYQDEHVTELIEKVVATLGDLRLD